MKQITIVSIIALTGLIAACADNGNNPLLLQNDRQQLADAIKIASIKAGGSNDFDNCTYHRKRTQGNDGFNCDDHFKRMAAQLSTMGYGKITSHHLTDERFIAVYENLPDTLY